MQIKQMIAVGGAAYLISKAIQCARYPHPQGLQSPPGLCRMDHQFLPRSRPRRLPHPEVAVCGPPASQHNCCCDAERFSVVFC